MATGFSYAEGCSSDEVTALPGAETSTKIQQRGEGIVDLFHLAGARRSQLANESLFGCRLDLIHNRDGRAATAADGDEQGEFRLIVRAGKGYDDECAAEANERLAGDDDGRAGLLNFGADRRIEIDQPNLAPLHGS